MSSNTFLLTSDQVSSLQSLPGNATCCDCSTSQPTWCSVSFGILLCLDCAGKHRGMGTHISFVRSLTMDSMTEMHYKLLQEGSNASCQRYKQQDVNCNDKEWYASPLAALYKEYLMAKVQGQEAPMKQYLQRLEASLTTNTPTTPNTSAAADPASTTSSSKPKVPHVRLHGSQGPLDFISTFHVAWQLASRIMEPHWGIQPWWASWALWGAAWWYTTSSSPSSSSSSLLLANVDSSPVVTSLLPAAATLLRTVLLRAIPGWWSFRHLFLPLFVTRAAYGRRLDATRAAREDATQRVLQGRAKTLPNSLLLFPPNASVGDKVDTALVFCPGLLVESTAYVNILGRLADQGILVVLLDHEATGRMAMRETGYTLEYMLERSKRDVEQLLGIQVGQWVMGGHSLGAYTAGWVCHDDLKQCSATKKKKNSQTKAKNGTTTAETTFSKCILWGSGSLCQHCKLDGMETLHIDASNDRVIIHSIGGQRLLRQLEERAQTDPNHRIVIQGGNHSGFADYDAQVFPFKDGTRSISLQQQQGQIVEATLRFLKSTSSSTSSSTGGNGNVDDAKPKQD